MRICITRSERHSYSETFIRDQINGLAKLAEIVPIHSGRLPERKEDGTLVNSPLFWMLHKVVKGITGKRNNYFGNFGLKKYFREKKIDVVLANYGLSAAHLAPICKDLSIPLLVIFHGHDATDKSLINQYKNKYKSLFAYASSIIVVSQDMRERIIEMGADSARVVVVPCGVDTLKFKPLTMPRKPLFLAVGRFVAKKGPLFTIEAFHKVWTKFPNASLVMVGGHRGLYSKCVDRVASLGMQNAVLFPGILNQEEIRGFMGQATAFVQHSITAPNGDMEGTPVSILEACASGLPVVSTYHGGIKDAIVHERTGYLVDEGDTSAMAAFMMKLLGDPNLGESMGQEGRLHIERNYNQKHQVQKLFDLAVSAASRQ